MRVLPPKLHSPRVCHSLTRSLMTEGELLRTGHQLKVAFTYNTCLAVVGCSVVVPSHPATRPAPSAPKTPSFGLLCTPTCESTRSQRSNDAVSVGFFFNATNTHAAAASARVCSAVTTRRRLTSCVRGLRLTRVSVVVAGRQCTQGNSRSVIDAAPAAVMMNLS